MRAALLAVLVVVVPATARADEPSPFDRLGTNVARAFDADNVFYLGTSVAISGVMAFGGVDHDVRVWTQEELRAPGYGAAAYYSGYVLPPLIAPGIYVIGRLAKDRTLAGAGAAATQALLVTLAATGFLKVATGRPFPTNGRERSDPELLAHPEDARDFVPFGLAGRYAWPSGHTSSTICIAAALTAYYPDVAWVRLVSYPIASAIALGMVVGDHHWASNIVAGAVLGQAVGWSIGEDFRRAVRGDGRGAKRWHVAPLAGARYGVVVSGGF